MARRLIEAGHKLVVYDTRNDAVAPLVALGAQAGFVAAGRRRPGRDGDGEPAVAADFARRSRLGEGGVIHGKRIKRFVDLSTTGSRVAAKIAAALAKKNIVQIDSPGVAAASAAPTRARSR